MRDLGLFTDVHRHTAVCLAPAVQTASLAGSNPRCAHNKKHRVSGVSFYCGRSDWVRTSDLYVPNVALYQAELHSENWRFSLCALDYATHQIKNQLFLFFLYTCKYHFFCHIYQSDNERNKYVCITIFTKR